MTSDQGATESTNEQGNGPSDIPPESVSSESELSLEQHLAKKEADEKQS